MSKGKFGIRNAEFGIKRGGRESSSKLSDGDNRGKAHKPDSNSRSFPNKHERRGESRGGCRPDATFDSPLWAFFGYFLARQKVTTSRPQTRREQRKNPA